MDTLDRLYTGYSQIARTTCKRTLAALLVLGVVAAVATCGAPAATPTPAPLAWTQKTDIQSGGRFGSITAVVDGKIYVMGGMGGETLVEVYDPSTDTWTQKASMLRKRIFSGAGVVNGKVYVIGGNMSGQGDSHAFVEEYDPLTDTWTEKASMPTPRDRVSTAVVGGKIYAMGGTQWDSEANIGKSVPTVEVYDPTTDTWTPGATMPTSRCLGGVGTVNDRVYVLGGQTDPTTGVLCSVLEYDPATDTWTEKCPMPARTTWGAAVVHNDMVYVFGGADSHRTPASSTVFVYDPTTDTWVQREDLPFERWGMSAEVVDGKAYLIGGSTEPSPWEPYLSDVWECDLTAAD